MDMMVHNTHGDLVPYDADDVSPDVTCEWCGATGTDSCKDQISLDEITLKPVEPFSADVACPDDEYVYWEDCDVCREERVRTVGDAI